MASVERSITMSNKTQSDRMFEALRHDILACILLPGSKLRISDIAETSAVSLGAVREALSRLGAEGLVVAESQKGYRVAPISAEDFRDLTEARVEIERIALARSIAAGDLDWETDLVAAWHRLSRISEQAGGPLFASDQWALAHGAFHAALVSACGSARTNEVIESRTGAGARRASWNLIHPLACRSIWMAVSRGMPCRDVSFTASSSSPTWMVP